MINISISIAEKDEGIRTFVIALAKRYGADSFAIVDHWESDLLAIGLACLNDHSVLAYMALNNDGSYYVELESAPEPGSDMEHSVVGIFGSLTMEDALDTVAAHLKLKVVTPVPPCSAHSR